MNNRLIFFTDCVVPNARVFLERAEGSREDQTWPMRTRTEILL